MARKSSDAVDSQREIVSAIMVEESEPIDREQVREEYQRRTRTQISYNTAQAVSRNRA